MDQMDQMDQMGRPYAAVAAACAASTFLAIAWPFEEKKHTDPGGGGGLQHRHHRHRHLTMESITYNQACFVWGYTLFWFAAQDAAKVAAYRVLRRAGWLPLRSWASYPLSSAGRSRGRGGGGGGGGGIYTYTSGGVTGVTGYGVRGSVRGLGYGPATLTSAELRRVEDAADDAITDGGPTSPWRRRQQQRQHQRGVGDASYTAVGWGGGGVDGAGRRRGGRRGGRKQHKMRRGRLDSSGRGGGAEEGTDGDLIDFHDDVDDVERGDLDPSSSSHHHRHEQQSPADAHDLSPAMPLPDYEYEEGMKPWAGLDDDDGDKLWASGSRDYTDVGGGGGGAGCLPDTPGPRHGQELDTMGMTPGDDGGGGGGGGGGGEGVGKSGGGGGGGDGDAGRGV